MLRDKMNDVVGGALVWVVIVIQVGIIVGIGYAAYHFVTKYW